MQPCRYQITDFRGLLTQQREVTCISLVYLFHLNLVPIIGSRHSLAIVGTIPALIGALVLGKLFAPTVVDGNSGIREGLLYGFIGKYIIGVVTVRSNDAWHHKGWRIHHKFGRSGTASGIYHMGYMLAVLDVLYQRIGGCQVLVGIQPIGVWSRTISTVD